MKGLYAVVDTKFLASRKTDPVAYARALLEVRPAALQLRAKDTPAREILALLRLIGPMCRAAGVPLVANDRADLAVLAGCAMVHIGQQDLPYELVHRIAPELAIGISTHNLDELHRALIAKPRYVAYGPVFETETKANADPVVGIEGLRAACEVAHAARIPLVAIGGITLANAKVVARWASACALISDLYPPGASLRSVTDRATQFQRIFGAFARDVEARS
ncbi:MAG: thiamine phosphate synthase [Polyangiaceae bacterium]|nr:thiamine phosphate synthase [Polyangiaceae bacterium]